MLGVPVSVLLNGQIECFTLIQMAFSLISNALQLSLRHYCASLNEKHPFCPHTRSVARKETLGVHQKNWVCHIYCQINAQKK